MKYLTVDNLEFEIMIDHDQIQKRIRLIGIDLNMRFENKHPVFIGVLNGCFMFMSDLMKQVVIPSELSFVKLASYKGVEQQDIAELIGVGMDLTGRDVIIVEDIIDSGHSLKHTMEALEKLGVASISVCALLMKPANLQVQFDNIMYIGFEIEKEFVIGYGLDYNGQCRNLPDIYQHIPSKS
ncbi:phosphoribosyltransferase [Sphingobacterium spiritivorum]|uniref:Hypoxanthine phosphoribosyltransferase n=1 Tax=Sphingobacterium spiritivorum ATCC 33861 TaxID=525373 RepID=D7VL76_SPHSI|nr:phosphoribosyltransferase family protein [Sphingobacterium spiritivorum]EFK58349.1 putative hypoxanthine phosphoribosyltransferase [Sphingobacterium spiritivorum ATCC 33861]QQT37098.1 hypoxanthine phosphoribosyltransferase [Sphingobacterium spiritivorum]WQD33871.1 phosphoribosyltransferase family protein [Sphingobacterium spiritivorum]SUJ27880.1 Hypoxanthine phosphoribosyltransferase [Sphingobacterium spiritivorum]